MYHPVENWSMMNHLDLIMNQTVLVKSKIQKGFLVSTKEVKKQFNTFWYKV